MPVTCREEGRRLTAAVSGELDHHRAREIMEELDRRIDAALPRELTLDLARHVQASHCEIKDADRLCLFIAAHSPNLLLTFCPIIVQFLFLLFKYKKAGST